MTGTAAPWWTTATVYQIYPRSFADSDGDGIGDLGGILQHVEHLSALGVDVVWLSPVYPSPQADNGYDISDYQDIEPTFGTLQIFDELLEAVHRRGMRLVMDLVVNHTSDQHPWFLESRSSRDNPKRDWYWWRPAREGLRGGDPGAEPTNWESFFSGPTWAWDEASGEYYLHLFTREQPDLNWENPEVRQAVYAMMRWWLERGVDGFRMDVIDMISKDPALPDGTMRAGARWGDGSPHYICGPRNHEFVAEMHREVFDGRDAVLLTVGETPDVTIEDARLFTDPARAELDMVFQFEHVNLDQGATKWEHVPLPVSRLAGSLARWQDGLADVGWNSLYWNNHDQPRAVSRFGSDGRLRVESATALATVLHLHRGTPYVYQGEELGMTNAGFTDIEQYRDVESLNHWTESLDAGADPASVLADLARVSRDNARTPMQWTAGPAAGFSTGSPWIGVNPNAGVINAEAARADPDSVFHHYRRLIQLRHDDPTVALGDFELIVFDPAAEPTAHDRLWAFRRTRGEDRLLVIANLSDEATAVPERLVASRAQLVLGNHPTDRDPSLLRPWEAWVLR